MLLCYARGLCASLFLSVVLLRYYARLVLFFINALVCHHFAFLENYDGVYFWIWQLARPKFGGCDLHLVTLLTFCLRFARGRMFSQVAKIKVILGRLSLEKTDI